MKAVTLLKSTISHLGGLEKYTLRLAQAFEKKGCDVTLLTTGNTENITPLSSLRVQSHIFSHKLSVFKVAEFDSFCQRTLRQNPASIIFGLDRNRHQTHIRAGNGVHAAYLKHRKRSEGILKQLSFALNPLHTLLLSIEKESFESPSLQTLFTNSHMVKQEILEHYHVDPHKIHVIHNGVEWHEMGASFASSFDNEDFCSVELGLDPEQFHFLFIGHNFKRKGLEELLTGLSLLRNKDFHLSVVGTDKNVDLYKKKVETLGLSRHVSFWGPRKDVIHFYQMADCLVIPSHYDPFANVTVEALAMGLFVISSKHNGAFEVIDPHAGALIEDLSSPESMREALRQAMQRPKDRKSATAIRESAKHLDFSHQLETMVNRTLETNLALRGF